MENFGIKVDGTSGTDGNADIEFAVTRCQVAICDLTTANPDTCGRIGTCMYGKGQY
jgi:hypothetical protein